MAGYRIIELEQNCKSIVERVGFSESFVYLVRRLYKESFHPKHATIEALPAWARQTLFAHEKDKRPYVYSSEQIESADTHDEVWNLAQRELLASGKIHGYMRMLWGKKIIEWSATPQEALATMIRLHHRYALDGRNPNTYTGILWCFGKHDRAWGPQRPVFGLVRYMTSENTRRKINFAAYKEWVESCENT